ncbi:MAG TPA: hypothetical protein VIY48_19065 [Candidatus Paceibacterota bacterium]
MSVPITPGTGASSVAGEVVSGLNYQQIEVYGRGGASVLGINPDGSISASIIGTPSFTVSGNASVSGTVGASVLGWVPTQPSNTSTIGVMQGSVATVIIGGSIAATFTPPANQSVSGTVQTDVRSSVATVIIGGSIAATFTPPANQSVSGAVQIAGASPSSIATVTRIDNQIVGSMLGFTAQAVIHGLTSAGGGSYVDVKVDPSGALVTAASSVVAFQGGTRRTSIVSSNPSSVLVGASIFGALPAGNAILGAVAASISGTVTTTITGSPSISGAVTIVGTSIPPGSVSGTVNTLQSGTVISSISGVVNVSGSIAGTYTEPAVVTSVTGLAMMFKSNVSTSTMGVVSSSNPLPVTFAAASNQSVSGTVGASIIGTVPFTQAGTLIASVFGNVSVLGTVPVTQVTSPWIITGSVQGTAAANQSVSGTVQTDVRGSVATVIIGGSIAATFTPPANQSVSGAVSVSNFPTTQNVSGSVVGFQGTSPWVVNFQNSSVIAVPVGSVITVVQGSVATAATIASVAAAEGFLRVAPPIGATVQGIADLQVVQGASVTAIAAQGASVFTYITGIQVTNFGSASVLVRLGGGLGSTLGWTIAPAGGGSNVTYPTGLKTGANSAFTASISGTASVIVSAQGFTAKT